MTLLTAPRGIPWLSAAPLLHHTPVEYPAAPYLLPFLALMAAGILSQAMTANFEWPYALRLFGAAAALWFFRHRYRRIDWHFSWTAVAAGIVVFLVWIAVDRLVHGSPGPTGMPLELAQASSAVQFAWLSARIAGAVLAVPIAEELAFRGFGLRKLVDADFDLVPWRSWNWFALGGSSILFGALHGGLWLAGITAGAAYGWLMIRRGRLGDSVAAHATTNAVLAAYVLSTGRWDLW